MKKKTWMIIAAAVLLAGAAVILLCGIFAGKETLSEEGFPYLCTIKSRKKGALIAAEGTIPEGYAWRTSADSYDTLKAERQADKPDRVSYLIRPAEVGSGKLQLQLANVNDPADVIAGLSYTFLTDSKGRLELIGFRGILPAAPDVLGAETEHPFSVSTGKSGTLTVTLPKTQKGHWELCPCREDRLTARCSEAGEAELCLLKAEKTECESHVYFYNEEEGAAFVLTVNADAAGWLSIEEYQYEQLLTEEEALKKLQELGYFEDKLEGCYGLPFLRTVLSTKGGEGLRTQLSEDGYEEAGFLRDAMEQYWREKMEEYLKESEEASRNAESAAESGAAGDKEESAAATGTEA